MCHHSGKNFVDSRRAATNFGHRSYAVVCKSTYRAKPHSIFFCHNIFVKEMCFLRPTSWHKERASVIDNFLAIWSVYCPKWAFLIGRFNKKQLPQEFWIKRSDHKVGCFFMKIQLQLLSYCKYSSSIMIILRQNINIGICSGAAMEEAVGKDQSICVEKRKPLRDTLTRAAWCGLLHTTANKPIKLWDY